MNTTQLFMIYFWSLTAPRKIWRLPEKKWFCVFCPTQPTQGATAPLTPWLVRLCPHFPGLAFSVAPIFDEVWRRKLVAYFGPFCVSSLSFKQIREFFSVGDKADCCQVPLSTSEKNGETGTCLVVDWTVSTAY